MASQTQVLAQLADLLGQLTGGDATPAATPAKRGSKAKADKVTNIGKVSVFTAGAVASRGIPRKVGTTFQYEGKRGTSTWKVTAANGDGSVTAEKVG